MERSPFGEVPFGEVEPLQLKRKRLGNLLPENPWFLTQKTGNRHHPESETGLYEANRNPVFTEFLEILIF